MYDNIGGKIKQLARITFAVEAISAIIGGIALFVNEEFLFGLLCFFAGPIVAWVSSWLLYGFGELIEDVGCIRQKYVGSTAIVPHSPIKTPTEKQQANILLPADAQKQKGYAWDHWNEEDSSIGTCDICGKTKQFLLHVEFDDTHGTHQKNLCYRCFSQRDCRAVEVKE